MSFKSSRRKIPGNRPRVSSSAVAVAKRDDALREDARFRILRLLSENPELSQREIASEVGISNGATNYLLKALVEKGHVKLANFQAASDKRRYAYILTPRGLAAKAELTRKFLSRKRAEFEALRAEIETLESDMAATDTGKA